MDFLAHARRQAFSFWLRTGRLPHWARGAPERKYNPWHDPEDGRFTFAGTGRYFGRGGSGRTDALNARMGERPKEPYGGYGGGDHFTGGFGGDFDGNSPAQQRARDLTRAQTPAVDRPPPPNTGVRRRPRAAIDNPRNWRRVEANGYVYQIDAFGRTRLVTGTITENPAQGRSPAAQAEAGGPDRRGTDHGGHFIARRFNGPTQEFNHFAQDANFNRSAYSSLENQWARSTRQGKRVMVAIEPVYEGSSQRPTALVVSYWTTGSGIRTVTFPNESRKTTHAKR